MRKFLLSGLHQAVLTVMTDSVPLSTRLSLRLT